MTVNPVENNNITTYVGAPGVRAEAPVELLQLTGHEWVGYAFNLCFGTTPGMIVYRAVDQNDQTRSDWIALPPTGVSGQVLTNGTGNQVAWGSGLALPSETGHAKQFLITDGVNPSWATVADACEFNLDGGGSPIVTGIVGRFLEIPFDCTIVACRMFADQTGDLVVDILQSTYAGFPTQASICAAALPTIAAGQKSQDTTLVGWTTAIHAGTILGFNVHSVTSITQATISLTLARNTS